MPTPLKAIRLHCLWCCNNSSNEVELCPANACPLHPYRFGHRPDTKALATDETRIYPTERSATRAELVAGDATAIGMIKRRCLDCSGGSIAEVKACRFTECSLHAFRLGKNPNRAGLGFARAFLAEKRPPE